MVNAGETMCYVNKDQVIEKVEWGTHLGECYAVLSDDGKNYTFRSKTHGVLRII